MYKIISSLQFQIFCNNLHVTFFLAIIRLPKIRITLIYEYGCDKANQKLIGSEDLRITERSLKDEC